ncbi:TM2 domain-containing protein [Phaeocystidibacter luteus]|uniref:TM2 domain-containing protein n=1 Tax=Phaeocystidibacter luteus TaxID=911197 RepID=A0A6N6RKH5_9FLAO|nr:TM2 domain-containing protein [Phaeocystidibacter luteus]KAB2810155.1 TM2 domain-containing protein [Phaeocystidibacter luteus]
MNRILLEIPEATGEELYFLERLLETCDQEQLSQFARIYRTRRRDPQNVLIFAVIGLFVIPGIQRLYLNKVLMAVLYLFTAGLCLIGSIIDIVNYKEMALEYNQAVAYEIIEYV